MTTDTEPAAPDAELWYVRARTDEELRRMAAARLSEHLEIGARLVARCEVAAETSPSDGAGPLLAAARLVRANAEVAQTLARLAAMERYRHKIFDPRGARRPGSGELNSKNLREG